METLVARSIFSPATGFIRRAGFDWTCNPYLGCTFGCTYCYAMFLPQNRRPLDHWGKWLISKSNAVQLAQKQAPRLAGCALYLSSVTDPYLPLENTLRLTRGILESLIPFQPRLLVQTRGPLVLRDVDLFKQFRTIRVNISIPTDSEEIRSQFEPKAPDLELRWQALHNLRERKIPVGICVTPALPLVDPESFARKLADFRADVLVVQEFHDAGRRFGANTGPRAREQLTRYAWSPIDQQAWFARLRQLTTVYEGEEGFFPP